MERSFTPNDAATGEPVATAVRLTPPEIVLHCNRYSGVAAGDRRPRSTVVARSAMSGPFTDRNCCMPPVAPPFARPG